MIPLLLKIKQGSGEELFSRVSDTGIQFLNKEYNFSAIYDNVISPTSIDRLTGLSCALVLLGPSGSGKTTTLKSILAHCMEQDSVLFTACEVIENTAFLDLLDNSKPKKYTSSLSMEEQLKKVQLCPDTVEQLFSDRKTSSTATNTQSSRSCLIVTMYNGKNTVAVVDMMGNEKFDPFSSNVFANSNVSSITQLLLSRNRTRSPNLVTNLIFQKLLLARMKFILHLDQCGTRDLIKSSLHNIVDVVRDFRVETSNGARELTSLPSFVPHYARPTAASLSPVKRGLLKAWRVSRPKIVKTPLVHTKQALPSVRRKLVSRPTSTGASKLYESQLKGLKEQNEELVQRNTALVTDAEASRDAYRRSLTELKATVETVRERELSLLVAEIESIRNSVAHLESANSALKTELLNSAANKEELESSKRGIELELQQLEQEHHVKLGELQDAVERASDLQLELTQKEKQANDLEEAIQNLSRLHSAALASKEIEFKILKETADQQTGTLAMSDATIQKQKHKIQSLARENEKAASDLATAHLALETVKASALELKAQLESESQRANELNLQVSLMSSSTKNHEENSRQVESALQALRADFGSLQSKFDATHAELRTLQDERDQLVQKHSDLVSLNKLMEEKHLAAMDERVSMQTEQQSISQATINELQARADEQKEYIAKLADEIETHQSEIEELSKYRTKCDGLAETVRKLTDDSIEQAAYYEVEIDQLNSQLTSLQNVNSTNEELKKQLLMMRTPSPQKSFNPSTDIFEDKHRDYLKSVKQVMRHTPSPKNGILRESNIMSSGKKTKRKSGLGTKSPKMSVRMSN